MVSRSFFVVNSCCDVVSQIVFQRSTHSGIPAFPTAMAQQNSAVLLEHRSFPLTAQWLDPTSWLLNLKIRLSFMIQEGSNLDTVGNRMISFFSPVKQQGQAVYTNTGTLLPAALHEMHLASWQFCATPKGMARDLVKKNCFYQAPQRNKAALMATAATCHVFFKDNKNSSILWEELQSRAPLK